MTTKQLADKIGLNYEERRLEYHLTNNPNRLTYTQGSWAIEGGEIAVEEWRQPTGAHDAYKIGDKVLHNGQTWVCTLGDGAGLNSWEPGVYGWEVVV